MIVTILCVVSLAWAEGELESIRDYWMADLEPFESERFISPEKCAECHEEIFSMWDGSLHSKSFEDPLFVSASKLFVGNAVHPGEKEDAEHCVACHNPIAYRSGEIKGSSGDYSNVGDVTKWSLSCDLCHSINEVVMLKNALFNTDPGEGEDDPGIKRGPRDDAMAMFHESEYSDIHTSSDVCGTCHNVTHLWYMTKLEGTYDEWYNSPYNSPDKSQVVTCQDCHMRQAPGNPSTGMTERPDYPGSSADMGEERPHIWRHFVAGANAFTPGLVGHPERSELAVERLQNAAVLEISGQLSSQKDYVSCSVRVRNKGAGHMLPTGVTEFRQMWLELTVSDKNGKTVYQNGGLDSKSVLREDTRIFQTVFGNPEGEPTVNVSEAAMMLTDRRIPPKGYCDELYRFGKNVKGPLAVKAELKYRSMAPSLVELLLKEKHKIPVVTMATVETVLK